MKGPAPIGSLRFLTKNISNIEIIPVVFITNKTILNIQDSLIKSLAGKIFKRIQDESFALNTANIKAIQIDCDWTLSTKSKYFALLNDLKALCRNAKISLSATIRLHQIKYYKITGVPPADRGTLMFYNMTPVSNINTTNSIFNPDIAKKYLKNFDKYPLKLDLILPAFSWGVLFHNNKISGLINDLNINSLKDNKYFIQKNNTIFKATRDNILNHYRIHKNDIIRIEEITPKTTKLAAKIIEPYIRNDSLVVSLYYLNKKVIKNYDKKDVEDITDIFD